MRDAADANSNGVSGMPAGAADADELGACLARLATGDLTARDRIIELVSARLRTLARRMLARFPNVRRWDDTDDVFQNAVLRLHRALGRAGGPPRSVMALAAAELHRELIDLARKYAGPRSHASWHATNTIRDAGGVAVGGQDVRALAPDEHLDRWACFHDVITGMPAAQREVFHLVWYLGLDQLAIANLLGCSPRTVKSRWREARDAMRAALDVDTPT